MTYGTKEAVAVLKAMENHSIENSGTKMVFNGPSGKYKAITGRARVDGAITGVIHKFMDGTEQGPTKLAGSFKILSDGYISRWTGVPTKVQQKISGTALSELIQESVQVPEQLDDVDYSQADEPQEQTVNDEEAA